MLLLVAASGAARADDGELHGTIVDHATAQPIGGVTIVVGGEIAASDDAGTFSVVLAPGPYTVLVSADWIVTAKRAVTIRGGTPTEITIEVDLKVAPSGEVIEVTGVAPTGPGETRVDAKLARSVPGSGGDAAKIVQSLPAVARPAAGSTDIVVWGAAPSETRVFVDGVPVPALYHIGGYRSAVGNELIGDIRLTPAAFGVDRGRAIGGVIDIGLGDPAAAPHWSVQADVLDGSAQGRTAIGRATIALAVRQSWLDRMVGLVEDPRQLAPNAPLPSWSDAQLVLRAPLGSDLVVTAWAIGSLDTLARTLVSDDPATQTEDRIDQRALRAQVTLRRDRPDGFESGTLWFGRDRSSDDLQVGLVPASQSSRSWLGGARAVQQDRIADGRTLTLGLDLDSELGDLQRFGSLSIPAREGDLHIFGQPPGDDIAADRWSASTIDAAGHAAFDLASGHVSGTVGLRVDTWLLSASRLTPRLGTTPGIGSQQIDATADPRGTLQVRASDSLVLRADAGRYHQARAASDTSAVFGTPMLGLESAWHVIVGTQWRRRRFAVEAAGYARWLDELVARDLAVTPPLARGLTQNGIGRVTGVQVTARVLGWRGLSGWLSYNLSRSERKDAADQGWRLFDHDQTHGLIAVAGWEHGDWTLGTRLRFATGEPRTAVLGAFFDGRTGRFEPVRGPHNGDRLPAFFAADLRGERRFGLGARRGAVYLEIQNITNRENAEEIIYSADLSQHGYLTGLPLLAIAGVRLER